MKLEKQAHLAALAAISIGSIVLAFILIVLVWFGPTLNRLAQKEQIPKKSAVHLIDT